MIDFSTYKFRCHALGNIMTNKQGKTDTKTIDELSETAKNYLIEIYIAERFQREKEIHSKYMEKGLEVEEDSITLYSRLKKNVFMKNDQRLQNEYLVGTPDTWDEKDGKVLRVIDFKSSWDVYTFFAQKEKKLNPHYEYQITGYCDLTGAPMGTVAYCLNDTPQHLIEQEKNKLKYSLGLIDPDAHPAYLEACEKIQRSLTFDDIPLSERVIECHVQRDQAKIEAIYERVELCRKWLNRFSERQQPIIKVAA